MGTYNVNIIALSNTVHQFNYEFGDEFFGEFGSDFLSKGSFRTDVVLHKHETFLEATFHIKGNANLVCDRSLEVFDYPIESHPKMVFKLGDRDEEISEEIVMIHRDTATLNLGQFIYEFIALAVPIKKLHPRFQEETEVENEEDKDGRIVYSSEDKNSEENKNAIDPRWNVLKKLK